MAATLRLRLVVCRNGLPETNVIWPVSLGGKPTIANLLEQVNEIIPLESTDWGLEDYAVELKGSDDSTFECLHFQSVQNVLKEDDRVFIRPLFTDDLRRRRVSGRHQISSDGKHLIDGIAFGRPLLKTPRGRPALDIPPRKRRRIGFPEDEEPMDMDEDEVEDEEEDTDYEYEEEPDEPVLLLTNGEEQHENRRKSVRIAADFDDIDAETGHGDFENDEIEAEDQEEEDEQPEKQSTDTDEDEDTESQSSEDEDDLAQELEDLRQDNLGSYHERSPNQSSPVEDNTDDDRGTNKEPSPQAAGSRDKLTSSGTTNDQIPNGVPGNMARLDKTGVLLAAFPAAPTQVCREILVAEEDDLRKSYLTLLQAFEPKISESEALRRWQNVGNYQAEPVRDNTQSTPAGLPVVDSTSAKGATQEEGELDDDDDEEEQSEGDDDGDEDVAPFIRRFDRQGLPPGSISSGNALKAMASISNSGTSNTAGTSNDTSQTVVNNHHIFPDSDADQDKDKDDTSSSEGNSSSSSEDHDEVEANESSSDDSSSDSDDDASAGANIDTTNDIDTSSSDDSSDSDSDSDGAPEEQSTKVNSSLKQKDLATLTTDTSSSEASSSSSEDSDADDETSSSEDSSDEDSSDSGSDSSPSSDSKQVEASNKLQKTASGQPMALPPQSQVAQYTGIPGSGKIATKRRNDRRRRKLRLSKDPGHGQSPGSEASNSGAVADATAQSTPKNKLQQDRELFEARRQALLEAIASGGVEVGPNAPPGILQAGSKRKRDKSDAVKNDVIAPEPGNATFEENATIAEEESPPSTQKRRRLDVGAGRRMLFGALGLKNPKSQLDENNLRDKLMKDVRPLQNARLTEEKEQSLEEAQHSKDVPAALDEDPDAWREKIIYRAVECCQEGVELSEPPFPFVQRWDPQQQISWQHKNNKRGGRGKRADRDQAQFYQQDGARGTKRSRDESQDWEEGYNDDSYKGVQEPDDTDIVLNYDDVETQESSKVADETTRLTDIDDLPSLPEDLSSLKTLHPGDAQTGMVITWKQFILSKATNWQPQVLSLTGVICRIDDDATGLEVMLAKRDRDLEQPEKQYDDNTGQRIYDKFEAPDVEDDGEDEDTRRANEGFRTLSFAEIMDPRILQPAIPLDPPSGEPAIPSIEEEAKEPVTNGDTTMDMRDTTFQGFDDSIRPHEVDAMGVTTNHDPAIMNATEKEPVAKISQQSLSPKPLVQGTLQIPSGDLPNKDDQPVNNSVSDLSQVSSPSRQLHDESASVLYGTPADESLPLGPSEDVTLIVEEPSLEPIMSDPAFGADETTMEIQESDVITGTPRATTPKPTVPPSSASSVRSGRQLDLSMDLDVDQPESFRATTKDSIEQNEMLGNEPSTILGEDRTSISHDEANDSDDQPQTPVPSSAPQRNEEADETPKRSSVQPKDTTSKKVLVESTQSTPCSLASLNTVWCTAASSRRTQSPSKTQLLSLIKSQKSQKSGQGDTEYEEAMKKLDDFSDEDEVSQSVSKISDSFKSKRNTIKVPTQSSSFSAAVNNDWNMGSDSDFERSSSLPPRGRKEAEISPPPTSRSRARAQAIQIPSSPPIKQRNSPPAGTIRQSKRVSQSSFSLPPGTQVLEISSDSDEPKFVEHYADDDKDENYSPANEDADDNYSSASLPRGSGWTKKSRPNRSSTAPLASLKKAAKGNNRTVSASQNSYGSQLKGMESAAAAMKRLNKGRKTSAKF